MGERALSDALSAAALLNLGVAELWSSRLDDARGHLELALELARRAGRPWLAVSPLGHLAIAGPWTGRSCLAGLGTRRGGGAARGGARLGRGPGHPHRLGGVRR